MFDVGLSLAPSCSYTSEPRSFDVSCNVTYSGQWKPNISCLPDSSDQVVSIYDSQPGVVVYRKTVNITSNITRYVISCQAFFNVSDLDDTTDNTLGITNTIIPSNVSLWNSSEILRASKYFCIVLYSKLQYCLTMGIVHCT